MADEDTTPRIQIDSDWKAQAQAEKERLAAEEKKRAADAGPAGGSGGRGELPPADMKGLMSVLASQAIMGLGAMQDPDGKGVMIDLEGAKFAIDLLGVLEEKTKGNLTDEESKELTTLLSELRSRFVQITQLLAQQAAQSGVGPGVPLEPPAGGVIQP
jgi:hypothetical protein